MLYTDFHKSYQGCPFCQEKNRGIVKYETAVLTYALAPYHKHHLLVIPKRHVESFLHLNAEEDDEIAALLRFGVRALHNLGYRDCTILVRDGKDAGKSVSHLHYHIIPKAKVAAVQGEWQDTRHIMTQKEIAEVVRDMKKAEQRLRSKR